MKTIKLIILSTLISLLGLEVKTQEVVETIIKSPDSLCYRGLSIGRLSDDSYILWYMDNFFFYDAICDGYGWHHITRMSADGEQISSHLILTSTSFNGLYLNGYDHLYIDNSDNLILPFDIAVGYLLCETPGLAYNSNKRVLIKMDPYSGDTLALYSPYPADTICEVENSCTFFNYNDQYYSVYTDDYRDSTFLDRYDTSLNLLESKNLNSEYLNGHSVECYFDSISASIIFCDSAIRFHDFEGNLTQIYEKHPDDISGWFDIAMNEDYIVAIKYAGDIESSSITVFRRDGSILSHGIYENEILEGIWITKDNKIITHSIGYKYQSDPPPFPIEIKVRNIDLDLLKIGNYGYPYVIAEQMHVSSNGDIAIIGTQKRSLTNEPLPNQIYFLKTNLSNLNIVQEVSPLSQLKTHPNPATDYIIFEVPKSIRSSQNQIVIYDVFGSEIDRIATTSEEIRWNCFSQSSGVFFYSLVLNGKSYYGKIIKQ